MFGQIRLYRVRIQKNKAFREYQDVHNLYNLINGGLIKINLLNIPHIID